MAQVNDERKSGDQWAISFSCHGAKNAEVAFTINAYCAKYDCIPVSVSVAYNGVAFGSSLEVAAIVKKR